MWITTAQIPRDRLEELKRILESGKFKRDLTFQYEIKNLQLIMKSPDKDIAHRRGMWFIHKFDSRMKYEVEWVKNNA